MTGSLTGLDTGFASFAETDVSGSFTKGPVLQGQLADAHQRCKACPSTPQRAQAS